MCQAEEGIPLLLCSYEARVCIRESGIRFGQVSLRRFLLNARRCILYCEIRALFWRHIPEIFENVSLVHLGVTDESERRS